MIIPEAQQKIILFTLLILDFDLFDEEPEFYSTHHLRNDRTGRIYTGNFALSVLNLRRIDLATEEDKKWKIDKWATLFKAKTVVQSFL